MVDFESMNKAGNKRGGPPLNEYTVLGGFAVAVLFMLLCGALFLWDDMRSKAGTSDLPTVAGQRGPKQEVLTGPAPSEQEYKAEVASVLSPFLSSALKVQAEDFAMPPAELKDLAQKTQDRLLRVRVPKEFKDGHLSYVLLLDMWKRALGGSKADQAAVTSKTAETLDENPWLQPTP